MKKVRRAMPAMNPVLRRELKERMRERRTGFVLTLYLLVLAFVLYGLYVNADNRQLGRGLDPLSTASLGRGMFETLLFAVLLLVCFLVPGYTAGAIVGERERQTLVPMQVTLLSPRSIVVGKLLASLAYLALLVVATVPLLAAAFLFGGVTWSEMLKGIGMVMVTGVLLASISLAVSGLARRVQTATVLAYGLTLALVLGTFAFYGFENVAAPRSGHHNKAVLVLNPLVATADAVAGRANDGGGSSSPLTGLRNFVHQNNSSGSSVSTASGFAVADGNGGIVTTAPDGSAFPIPLVGDRPPHQMPYAGYSLVCFALLTLAALGLAVRRIKTPAATDRT